MAGLIIIIIVLIVLFNPGLLPRIGGWLGGQSRKRLRQAKWMWSLFAGTEEESIRAERDYGQECARAFEKHFSGKVSHSDQELVATIGSKVMEAVGDPRRTFCFTVVVSKLPTPLRFRAVLYSSPDHCCSCANTTARRLHSL